LYSILYIFFGRREKERDKQYEQQKLGGRHHKNNLQVRETSSKHRQISSIWMDRKKEIKR
jgi:hypothetical protein